MSIQAQPLSEQDHKAIICICILAAFADGAQSEVERAEIERIVAGFSEEHLDLASDSNKRCEGFCHRLVANGWAAGRPRKRPRPKPA